MKRVARLIHAIDQVLARPNEDALKILEGFLQDESISKDEIGVWALAKPCQIIPLARIVVEASAAPGVSRTMISSPEFVNAVLEGDSTLFDGLINKVDSNLPDTSSPGWIFDYPILLSCSALKHEALLGLNEGLVHWAAVCATGCPNEANLRHLSELCSAISSNILDLFSEKLLREVSSCCKEICSCSIETENHIEIMLAQAILAQLAVAFQTPQTPSKSSLETPPGAKFSEACRKRIFKLFVDDNAASILKTTVLRLAMFCSKDRKFSPSVALEGIKLARRIIEPIPPSVRRQWVASYPEGCRKSFLRLCRQGQDQNVRLEGAIFCSSLLGAQAEMLPYLEKAASTVLVDFCENFSATSAMATESDKAVGDLLGCLCFSKDSPQSTTPGRSRVLARLMSMIVEECQPWPTNGVNTVLRLYRARSILKSVRIALSQYDISAYIVEFIELGSLPEWWGSEVTFSLSPRDGEILNCAGEEVCSKSLSSLRSELATNFSSLLLTAAWHSGKPLRNPEACQRLLNRLKGPSLRETALNCSYIADCVMGLQDTGALTEAQTECRELRTHLQNEQTQRRSIEGRLAQREKLLKEERQASNALQQYLEAAGREGFETGKALETANENYQELLQEADRRVGVLESNFELEKLMLKADFYGRETKLEDELDEIRSTLEQKDEEIELEKQNRATFAAEMEAALARSNEQIEKLLLKVTEKDKALAEADTLRAKLMELLGGSFY